MNYILSNSTSARFPRKLFMYFFNDQIFTSGRLLKWIKDTPQLMNTIQTKLGSSTILSCAMSHPAKAVTFYKKLETDGGKLSPLVIDGKKYQLLNRQELVIYNVQNTDDGVYVCQAENKLLQDKEIKIFINQCKLFLIVIISIPKSKFVAYVRFGNLSFNLFQILTSKTNRCL